MPRRNAGQNTSLKQRGASSVREANPAVAVPRATGSLLARRPSAANTLWSKASDVALTGFNVACRADGLDPPVSGL